MTATNGRMPRTGPYDNIIRNEVATFLPDFYDWRLLKAQMYQESLFNPTARSPVGALGVAQFMPATWKQMARELRIPDGIDPTNPQWAIRAACYYMNKLRTSWSAPRTEMDRTILAMASYNAGFGNLLRAQKKANMKRPAGDIMAKLHLVTGKHASETRTYIHRILRYYTTALQERSE